jgi:NAD(P)-dependent dehydrogenase (short-subunit alcohol dehydrogenase family)
MRIVTGTFSHETNTFSNIPTTMEEFAKQGILHGEEIPRRFRGTNAIEAAFLDASEKFGFELIWTVYGSAIPGGPVSREAYEYFSGHLLEGIQGAGRIDGVLLHLHGAMVTDDLDDGDRLDCTFNNAGYEGLRPPTAGVPGDDWERVIRTNLTGVWLCMKYAIRQMLSQGSGVIVNMSPVVGHVGSPGRSPALVASHHGIIGLTRQAAVEYAKHGIRINAVCPTVARTARFLRVHGSDPEVEACMAARNPPGRIGTPEDAAEAVVWLCSAAAAFVVGHTLMMDGGGLAQ